MNRRERINETALPQPQAATFFTITVGTCLILRLLPICSPSDALARKGVVALVECGGVVEVSTWDVMWRGILRRPSASLLLLYSQDLLNSHAAGTLSAYIHTYINIYIHTYIYAYIYTYKHTHTNTHTHTYIYIHTYTHIYIQTHTHTHTHIYIHIYTHIYIQTHTHTHTHTHTCRHKEHV